VVPRPDALCPGCGALERHRFAALLLTREGQPGAVGRTLHIAPEPAMVRFLSRPGGLHVRADLSGDGVDVRFDLTRLPHPDSSFRLVYCSHVLEHVEDDRAAIREMHRVLEPGGLALVQIPVDEGREHTFEDATARTASERLRLFGQDDHVRIYGLDAVERLRAGGFEVTGVRPGDILSPDEVVRLGLDARELAFLCRRSAA
jgi:SAM-dependent methyltransferase